MEKPEILIINSGVYNRTIRLWLGRDDYLTADELNEYRDLLEKRWKESENELVAAISDSLGWPWQEKVIRCYVTGTRASFSDPLTVGYKKDSKLALDMLTHELIHRYISQPIPELKDKLARLYASYASENQIVKNHIVVHAIHEFVYRGTGREDRLEVDIANSQAAKDYARAWEIVADVGYEIILKKIAPDG